MDPEFDSSTDSALSKQTHQDQQDQQQQPLKQPQQQHQTENIVSNRRSSAGIALEAEDDSLNVLAYYKGAAPYLINDKLQRYSQNGLGYPSLNNGGSDDKTPPTQVKKADFEQAIELAGYGKFHYILLAICGLVSTSEEMDVISMSFILPSAQCDLDLNTQTKGWLNSIIFIGMMVGAYVWGSIADTMGRKKVLIVISIMNGLCIVASSFCQTYLLFMIFRFLNGVA